MQSFLDKLPKGYRELFGISEILNPECLAEARATAFTWTELPGRVCLGLNRKYYDEAAANDRIVAIVASRAAVSAPPAKKKAVIIADKPDELFYAVHNTAIHESHATPATGRDIHPSARVAASARLLGDDIRIGANTVVHDGCVLIGPLEIGADCIIMPGVMLGTDGMFSKKILGRKTHVHHFGGLRIGGNCIIHAGTIITKSVNFGEATTLEDDVNIGIGANIGHDSWIGADSEISGRVMLAGRVTVGKGCWLGAGVILSNAIEVGDRAKIRIGSVVVEDVAAGADISGNFASDHKTRLKQHLTAQRK